MNWPQLMLPVSLHCCGRGGGENQEWSWACEEGRGGRKVFKKLVLFLITQFLIFIGNKLIFPQVKSLLPRMGAGEGSLPVLASTHEPLIIFFSPTSSWGEAVIEQLQWAPGIQPGPNHHKYYKQFFKVGIRDVSVKVKFQFIKQKGEYVIF